MTIKLCVLAAMVMLPQLAQAQQHNRAMRLEIDNDSVEVIRVHLDAHQRLPMHDVTPRVVVWLTDAHLRATLPDGTTREERARRGQVDWVPAQRHAAENLDDHAVDFVAVIPKLNGRP